MMSDVLNFLSFQVHGNAGGHKSGDEITASVTEVLTFFESLVGLSPSEMISVILPGFSTMTNVHPLIVHFPIAFLIAFFVVDFCGSLFRKESLRQLASGFLYLGTITACAAVVAGLMAAESVNHGENVHLIMEKHKTIGFSILSLSVFLSIWRLLSGSVIKGFANAFFLLLALVLNILIVLGGDLGGLMVYKYGVAVEAVEVNTMDYFQEHTHSH